MSATSIDRRVENLEAEAFRTTAQQRDTHDRLEHLTSAIGDLSQNSRALTLDVREIRTELQKIHTELREVHTTVDSLNTEVRDGFAQIQASIAALTSAWQNRPPQGQ